MEITQNGTVSIVPNGIDEMEIEVNVPVANVQDHKDVDIYESGETITVSPDVGYDALGRVNVTNKTKVLFARKIKWRVNASTERVVAIADNITPPAVSTVEVGNDELLIMHFGGGIYLYTIPSETTTFTVTGKFMKYAVEQPVYICGDDSSDEFAYLKSGDRMYLVGIAAVDLS